MDSGGSGPGCQLPHLRSEMWGTLMLNEPGKITATRRTEPHATSDSERSNEKDEQKYYGRLRCDAQIRSAVHCWILHLNFRLWEISADVVCGVQIARREDDRNS